MRVDGVWDELEADALLRTELGAGHGGPSGRYDAWREEALILAFVLDVLGVERSNLYRKMRSFGIASPRRGDDDPQS